MTVSNDKRLSLSCGGFSCDIVGYDDPIRMLGQVVEIFSRSREGTPDLFEAADPSAQRRFAAALAENALALDMTVKEIGGRLVVSAPGVEAETAAPATAARTAIEAAPAPRAAPFGHDAAGVTSLASAAAAREAFAPTPSHAARARPAAEAAPDGDKHDEDWVDEDWASEERRREAAPAAAPKSGAVGNASADESNEDHGDDDGDDEAVDAGLGVPDAVAEMFANAAGDIDSLEEKLAAFTSHGRLIGGGTAAQLEIAPSDPDIDLSAPSFRPPASRDVSPDGEETAGDGPSAAPTGATPATEEPEAGADDSWRGVAQRPVATTDEPVEARDEPADEAEDERAPQDLAGPASENERDDGDVAGATNEPAGDAQSGGQSGEAPTVRVSRPRIVVDHSRSRPHLRARSSLGAAVVRAPSSGTGGAAAVDGAHAGGGTSDGDDADTEPLTLQNPSTPFTQNRTAIGDENFLFSDVSRDGERVAGERGEDEDDEPVGPGREAEDAASTGGAPAAGAAAAAPPDGIERRRARGFSLFRRRASDHEESDAALRISDEDSRFERLRQTAEASLPKLDQTKRDPAREASEPKLFAVRSDGDLDPSDGPGAFARRVGAQSLQDLLEASAAYMAIVEGKSKFSRRDVMQALSEIGLEEEFTPEARLKSFRKLVTNGAIIRADDGMFAISHATRFGYESQLRSG